MQIELAPTSTHYLCKITCSLLQKWNFMQWNDASCPGLSQTGMNLVKGDSRFHGVMPALWCSARVVCVMGKWVGERVSNFMILLRTALVCKRSDSRWQKNSLAWLGTSPSPTVYFLPFARLPCLCSHFSTATQYWRDIPTYARLMKTCLCR